MVAGSLKTSQQLVSLIVLMSHAYFEKFLPSANEVWAKVIFSVACVKNSVHRWGGLPQCMLGYHPPSRLPRADTPSPGVDPAEHAPPGEGTPHAVHAGRYGQQGGGMHPTGMHSCAICYLFYFSLLLLFLFWVFKSRNRLKISLLSMKLSNHIW